MFIELTHSRSGQTVYLKPQNIDIIRKKTEGETLVINNESNKGMYVRESAEEVVAKIKEALGE